jgi:DNA-binding MarR family transcriptional regulator
MQHSLLKISRLNLLIHNLNKRCEQKHGISLVQWCVLKHLIDLPGTSAHHLSNSIGVHRSTLTPTLKRLEKKEFIFINKNHQDARKKVIAITRLGKIKLETIENFFENAPKTQTDIEGELLFLNDFISALPQS